MGEESAEYYINSVVCAGKMEGDGFFGRIDAGDSFGRKSRDLVDKDKCVRWIE